MREHLKKTMSNSQYYQKRLSESRQEILKLSDQKKRLSDVANKKDLLGREKLSQQLQLATQLVKDKELKTAVRL